MKLHEFVVRRLLLLIPVMVGVTVLTFAISHLIPADAAAAQCGDKCGIIADTYYENGSSGEPYTSTGELYTLDDDISLGANNITLSDASKFVSEGGIGLIGNDSFTWSGKNGKTLTGVNGIDSDASEGTEVSYFVRITAYEANRERLGMNQPLIIQFWKYVNHLGEGDWGESSTYHRPVVDVVKDAAPITLEMSFFALFIAYPLGITLGIISAVRQDRMFDHVARFFAIAFVSLPIFWFAMVLQLLFATGTEMGSLGICDPVSEWLPIGPDSHGGCFPIYGRHDPSLTYPEDGFASYYPAGGTGFHLVDSWFVTDGKLATLPADYGSNRLLFKDTLMHLALPCACLGIASSGSLLRYMRASLLEVLHEDYVRTARAKGLSEFRVVIVHACRNALVPIVTILGFSIGGAIGGAVLTETIFAFNGMGRVAVKSIQYLDFPVIMGVTLITAAIFLLSNLIVDILYAIIDPRVRLE
jgi:ABC-type dipeptide/oligopeptide/nickel transport system permease component